MTHQPHELLTPRLRLRRWRDEDEAPMAAINSDPAVGMSIQFQVFNPVHDLEVDIWGREAPTAA